MRLVKKEEATAKYEKKIYKESPIFITAAKYWDGGISVENSLNEKKKFYCIAEKMSSIIKYIIRSKEGYAYIGNALCENGNVYAHWTDLEDYELFRLLEQKIKRNRYYKITSPIDDNIVDIIVEGNFRYYSHFSFYLPVSQIILEPTCHTETLVYARDSVNLVEELQQSLFEYSQDINVIKN